MVYTVGPLLVFTEGKARSWLKYTLNDEGQISVWTQPYSASPKDVWQEQADVNLSAALAYDSLQKQFYHYRILDNKLWRITFRLLHDSVMPAKFEQAQIKDTALVFVEDKSQRTALLKNLMIEKIPVLDEAKQDNIASVALQLQGPADLVTEEQAAAVGDFNQVHDAAVDAAVMLAQRNAQPDARPALSIDDASEQMLPLGLSYVSNPDEIAYANRVLYVWKQAESWHYQINFYGEILSGNVDLQHYPVLENRQDVPVLNIDSERQRDLASIYLKLSTAQRELVLNMLEPTWPFAEPRERDEQISLALAVLKGSSEALSEPLQTEYLNYRSNFSSKYIQEQIAPELFYMSQEMLPEQDRTKVSDIVVFAQYMALVAIRDFDYVETIVLTQPPQSLMRTLKSPVAEDAAVTLLDADDLFVDDTNDELIALALARGEEDAAWQSLPDEDAQEAFVNPLPRRAPEPARPLRPLAANPNPPVVQDALLQRFNQYYESRFNDRKEYFFTSSLFGFFQHGWGVSRTDKLAASRWVINVVNGRTDYTEQDYQRHSPALHQGRLGHLFAALVERDGDNWHRARNAPAV